MAVNLWPTSKDFLKQTLSEVIQLKNQVSLDNAAALLGI